MRILHFYKTAWPSSTGGVEEMIHQLSSELVKKNIEVEVLALARDKSFPNNTTEYPIHRSALSFELASTGFSFSAIKDFKTLAAKANLIHYHFPWPFMDLVHFITKVNKPFIVTYHSDIVKQKYLFKLYKPLMYKFLKAANKIVATSPQYAQSSEVLQHFQDKVSVIPIGLNSQNYIRPTKAVLEKWRAFLGEKFFLFVGVLRYYKGLEYLIEAAKKTKFPVVIAGDGPLMQSLKHKAQGYDNIKFLGFVTSEDKMALIELSRALVFPSHLRSEAFGISLLEASMLGKPMICAEIGTGTSFININEKTGLVVPPSDSDAIASAMQKLWVEDSLVEAYGKNAKARYEENFTSKLMAKMYVELYESLL